VVEQIADTAADGADEMEAIAPQAGKIEPSLSTEADEEATMPHLAAEASATRAPRRAQAEPAKPEDLVIIEGIGPKIAGLLQKAGINTFARLATTDVSQIRQILQEAGLANIADPATWPEQAQLAADGNWEALKSLQENLKAGRRA
jgi:predicted flap endonuclease-1-like 5' DNA nuclease